MNCGRCHMCGTVLVDRANNQHCPQCRTTKNYYAHGRGGRAAHLITYCPADLMRDAQAEVTASSN